MDDETRDPLEEVTEDADLDGEPVADDLIDEDDDFGLTEEE